MAVLRYDIARPSDGRFEKRWWRIVNTPILDGEGFVRLIVNHADDVTEMHERGLV